MKATITEIYLIQNCNNAYPMEQLKKESEERSSEMELLTAKITILEQSLKQAVEQNITLEQYTRRENLRFNNIKEHEGEDCEKKVFATPFEGTLD